MDRTKPTGKTGHKSRELRRKGPLSDYLPAFVLAVSAFLLYANTLGHGFVYDDQAVIASNKLVQQGVSAVPELMKTAYWYGLTGKNESFYRPLSLVMFALEQEVSPGNPAAGHFMNVLLYAITAFFLFLFLRSLLRSYWIAVPFVITALWIVLPVHTEVVANIKSRDEILAFLFSILALDLYLKYARQHRIGFLAGGSLCFFLALLSKESPLTFIAIIPLTLYFFTDADRKSILISTGSLVVCAAIYFAIRSLVVTIGAGAAGWRIVDNALVATPDHLIRFATAVKILGLYLLKTFFPVSLSSDYSYDSIRLTGIGNAGFLISFVIYATLLVISVLRIRKKEPIIYGILFYLLTISMTSNIFFLASTTMAERLLYMPSLGLILSFTAALCILFKVPWRVPDGASVIRIPFLKYKVPLALVAVLTLWYTVATYGRNKDWADNLTLFSTDIQRVPNSAKMKVYYSNEIYKLLKSVTVPEPQRSGYLQEIRTKLSEAAAMDSTWEQPLTVLANVEDLDGNYTRALAYNRQAYAINPRDALMPGSVGNSYFRLGQYDTAMAWLNRALERDPNYGPAYASLGSCFGMKGDYLKAIDAYRSAIKLDPLNAETWTNLGLACSLRNQNDSALLCYTKALELDPRNATVRGYLENMKAR